MDAYFFEANSQQEVNRQSKKYEIGLNAKYINVEVTTPILYDIQNRNDISNSVTKYANKGVTSLPVATWKLKIDHDHNLSFMENIHKYILLAASGCTSIATRKSKTNFPVIDLNQNEIISNYPDYLAIDITQ